MAVLASDGFAGTSADLGVNWAIDTGNPWTRSSDVAVPSTLAGACGEIYTAITWPNDQYAQAKISVTGGSGDAGCGVQCRGTAGGTYYFVRVNKAASNNVNIGRRNAAAQTVLTTATVTWVDGDVLRLEVSGASTPVLVVKRNGGQIATFTDTDTPNVITSGAAGVEFNDAVTAASLDDWEGGDLVAATFAQTRYRWRNDDGSESTATPAAAENTAMTAPAGVNRRLRVLVETAGGDPATAALQLEWQLATSPGYVRVNPVVAANPTVVWRDTFAQATNATAVVVTWDAGVPVAGQLLLLIYSVDGAETCTINTGTFPGWVKLGDAPSGTASTVSVFYKVSTGGETTVTVGHTSEQSAATILCIADGGTPVGSSTTGTTANANPPNRNPGVSLAYLWVAACGHDGGTVVATAAPATYSTLTTIISPGTGGCSVSVADKVATASADDPAAFTSAAEDWAAWTISVPPVTPAAIALALSSNFAPGAATAQLTAPGGKTFGGGRIEEAANPATTVDLALDQYGEWEWCVQANTSVVTDGQVIECRVTRAGAVLDTYSVTPSWTIGAAVAAAVPGRILGHDGLIFGDGRLFTAGVLR